MKSKILKEIVSLAKNHKKKIIVSYHNFSSTPPFRILEKILTSSKTLNSDVIKIAIFIRKTEDLLNLIILLRKFNNTTNQNQWLAVIPMGKLSKIFRIIFLFFNSYLIYSYIKKPISPGQNSLKEVIKIKSHIEKFI